MRYDIILLCFILMKGQGYDITDWTTYRYSCFYGQWLINRVREGFVDVRNPYNPTGDTVSY